MNGLLWIAAFWLLATVPVAAGPIAAYTVGAPAAERFVAATGTVQAVRAGAIAAEAGGRITAVLVRSGDAVRAGQPLVRIETGDASDAAAAASAMASGAAARLVSARGDYERAQRLRAQDYISVAAMQRIEAALRSAEAEAQAAAAQEQAAHVRLGWHTVLAPYDAQVTALWVSAGDSAIPGKPLLDLYDPGALRVIAQIPESLAARVQPEGTATVSGRATGASGLTSWQIVPAVDPVTHSVEVRAELGAGSGLTPGEFVTLMLPAKGVGAQLRIPRRAIVQRSEVTGVYVLDPAGGAHLRQIRLGPMAGDDVEVLSGLRSGEQIALDPGAVAAQ